MRRLTTATQAVTTDPNIQRRAKILGEKLWQEDSAGNCDLTDRNRQASLNLCLC